MKIVSSLQAWYPAFHLGAEPGPVPCQLSIVEANGRRYLKTPFAMLDAYGDDDAERQLQPGRGYYATAAECQAYLDAEYPWWKRAVPIMDKLCWAYGHSTITGPCAVADKAGVPVDSIHKLARGHRSCGLKAIKAAVKALEPREP